MKWVIWVFKRVRNYRIDIRGISYIIVIIYIRLRNYLIVIYIIVIIYIIVRSYLIVIIYIRVNSYI